MDDSFVAFTLGPKKTQSSVGWHYGMSVQCKAKVVGMVILRNGSLFIKYAFIQYNVVFLLFVNSSFNLKCIIGHCSVNIKKNNKNHLSMVWLHHYSLDFEMA